MWLGNDWLLRGGPLQVINGVISRVITPVTHLSGHLIIGVITITPFTTGRAGPPCMDEDLIMESMENPNK